MQSDILPPDGWAEEKPTSKKQTSAHAHSVAIDHPKNWLPDSIYERLGGKAEDRYTHKPVEHPKVETSVKKARRWHHWSKQKLAAFFLVIVLMSLSSLTVYANFIHKPQKPAPVVVKAQPPPPPPKPKTVAAPLTGTQIDPELAKRPVTGIMVENSIDARPQSGLQDAGVIFEAIAEGGITRFIALFQDARPQYIGPVRSVRPYYLDFGAPFQASFAHVGGSPDGLAQVRNGMRDLDQFFNAGSYWRESSRFAPHNVYTSFDKLDALNQSKGYATSQFTPWNRKEDKPLKPPTAAHIDVSIASELYNSHYDYDAATNSYLRFEGGRPHLVVISADDKTGQQLKPKVLVVLEMSRSVIDSSGHNDYAVNGTGSLKVFQDGGETDGTWSKTDRNSMFAFKDTTGKPLALNAGQTWVAVVNSMSLVKATP
jgi:hypothetical protein